MSANEKQSAAPPQGDAGEVAGRPKDPRGEQPLPLFLRDGNEGRKGDEQDEKDSTGE